MIIKNNKSINDYKYLLMFDLASKISGVCLFDIHKHEPIETMVLKVTGKLDLPCAELEGLINKMFQDLESKGYNPQDILVSKECAPLQAGRFTTAQTLIALGKSHAMLDAFCFRNNIDVYDYNGVAPITAHSYFKKLLELDKKAKVDKTDIARYIKGLYNISTTTLDETDAVFLAITLIDHKWNNDLVESIKELKKHKKTLKAQHAIAAVDLEIERLEKLKN